MTENENFLVSIGFTQEEYKGSMWWVDPFFDKDDEYRYLFLDADDTFSVKGKSIEWIMKAIKANVSNQATRRTKQEVKEEAAREIETALKKVMKSFLK